jgi:hypothetical protein
LQGSRFSSVVVRLDDDVHILIEGYEEAEQALDGELAEVATKHLGNIGLTDAEQGGGIDLLEAAMFQDVSDPDNQFGFDQVFLGVRQAKIVEHVART